MKRFLEFILGLDRGFLSREGEFHVQFNPRWPFQETLGAATWNFILAALAIALVVWVYRREGRSRPARIMLGGMRALLLAFLIAMLNRPVLTLSQSRTEPSVVAVVMDDTISMRVKDGTGAEGDSKSRAEAMIELLRGQDQKLVRDLANQHVLRFYRFNRDAQSIATVTKESLAAAPAAIASSQPASTQPASIAGVLDAFQPMGQSTQVLASLRTVLEELQGQRLAGAILLTDGRSTPPESMAELLGTVKEFGIKIFSVVMGADRPPQNVIVETVNVQEAAFVKDIVNVRAMVRGIGYPAGHTVELSLKNKKTNQPLLGSDGQPVRLTTALSGDRAQEVELNFRPTEVGTLDVEVVATAQAGEVDEEDNTAFTQLAVLDAKITVLYVDGYPRWEYRYIKNEMIREPTVNISCLLYSADQGFAQEGDTPITRFPESMTEMLMYDVVVFGDVDPRQFTDAQLQLVSDFVSKKGGGFGMVAGPRWSPAAYRNTVLEAVLPVSLARVQPDERFAGSAGGFRPVLTKDGYASTIYRFFEDRVQNDRYLKEDLPVVFWYSKGVTAKDGIGEVYAEHPTETDGGPYNRKAPLMVLGRFGAGRTLFSGIDDSWRWRFYTGETIFDTYWLQQFRYLARSKKLGQRRFTLNASRPSYELGEKVEISLRVLDPELQQQLPEQIGVTVLDGGGTPIRQESLQRREGQADWYVASWTADSVGRFSLRLPAIASGTDDLEVPLEVKIPRLELIAPQVDRVLLSRLASETLGEVVPYEQARSRLPSLITSAAKIIPVDTNEPLWDAPLAMIIFVLLIAMEWVFRKVYGML